MTEEITEEMLIAGIDALPASDEWEMAARSSDPSHLRGYVSEIYLAMRRAAPQN